MESKEIKTEIKKNLCKCGKEKKGNGRMRDFAHYFVILIILQSILVK